MKVTTALRKAITIVKPEFEFTRVFSDHAGERIGTRECKNPYAFNSDYVYTYSDVHIKVCRLHKYLNDSEVDRVQNLMVKWGYEVKSDWKLFTNNFRGGIRFYFKQVDKDFKPNFDIVKEAEVDTVKEKRIFKCNNKNNKNMNKIKNVKKFFQMNVDVEVNTKIEVTDDFGSRIIPVQMDVEVFIMKSKAGTDYEISDYISGIIGGKKYDDFLHGCGSLKKTRTFFEKHGIDFDAVIDENAKRTVKNDDRIQTMLRHYECYMM